MAPEKSGCWTYSTKTLKQLLKYDLKKNQKTTKGNQKYCIKMRISIKRWKLQNEKKQPNQNVGSKKLLNY